MLDIFQQKKQCYLHSTKLLLRGRHLQEYRNKRHLGIISDIYNVGNFTIEKTTISLLYKIYTKRESRIQFNWNHITRKESNEYDRVMPNHRS